MTKQDRIKEIKKWLEENKNTMSIARIYYPDILNYFNNLDGLTLINIVDIKQWIRVRFQQHIDKINKHIEKYRLPYEGEPGLMLDRMIKDIQHEWVLRPKKHYIKEKKNV